MEASPSSSSIAFYNFLDRMRNPASVDLVRAIKSFIVSFSFCAASPENDGKRVQEFFAAMESAFNQHPLWAAASDQEIDSAMEALEKYVMTKLFPRTFASSSEDSELDLKISRKISSLQTFFQPRHLDIAPRFLDLPSLLLAEKELQKINSFKCPREKLSCIVSCCKVINNLLLNASISDKHLLAGADDFLPLLIYVIIKANPPQLHSNLRFIQLYRRQAKLVSESAYYFTNLVSSKTFIVELNAKSISMDETEYEESMEAARQASELATDEQLSVSELDHTHNSPMAMIYETSTGGLEYPFMEAEAGDLTVKDVEVLLNLYKDIVKKYTNLSNAVKRAPFSINSEIQCTTSRSINETSEGKSLQYSKSE